MEAIIVGCGVIGSGNLDDINKQSYFSNHHAEYVKKGIPVTWLVDTNKSLLERISSKLKVSNFATNLKKLCTSHSVVVTSH